MEPGRLFPNEFVIQLTINIAIKIACAVPVMINFILGLENFRPS